MDKVEETHAKNLIDIEYIFEAQNFGSLHSDQEAPVRNFQITQLLWNTKSSRIRFTSSFFRSAMEVM